MILPFDLRPGHLAVVVPRPDVRKTKLADGTTIFEAYNFKYLNLQADRGLYDIGFMLNVQQFAILKSAERYTLLALQRRLGFAAQLNFPGLSESGVLIKVEGSRGKFVWATIPGTVITTSKFTVLDLRDSGMALEEMDAIQENIDQAIQGCPDADADFLKARFE